MHVCHYLLFLLAGWDVDVMAGALVANSDHETKTEGAWDLHNGGAAILALNDLPGTSFS